MSSVPAGQAPATSHQPAAWRDGKRYAWLLGIVVPTLPFIVYGLVHLTGLGVFWFFGPVLIFGVFPPLDLIIGLDTENPPRQRPEMARAGSLLPLVHLRVPAAPVRRAGVRVLAVGERRSHRRGQDGAGADRGRRWWSFRNNLLNAWAMTVALFGGLMAVFGLGVLPYLLVQMLIGFPLLEVVNYLEHYGLLRQKREDGRYERTRPEHSWNSNNVASNVLLYHLQRHSDHHANPTRRFQALRHFDAAPQLPTGYAGMILLALVPPLWRRVMDPRLIRHYGGDATRANIHPRVRGRVLARYGPAG